MQILINIEGVYIKFLPSSDFDFSTLEKVRTYNLLSKAGCPVLKSVLIENNDILSSKSINQIARYLGSNYCTLRYQYIEPNKNPVRGGNRVKLDYDIITKKIVSGALLWLMEPLDRLNNLFGINMLFDRKYSKLIFECVGRGFDTSNLNRSDICPHQIIYLDLPIEYGWNGEWWKYANFEFVSDKNYQESKFIRLQNLKELGINASIDIFPAYYEPLPMYTISRLLEYAELIYNCFRDNYFVVTSSIVGARFIFWDISTPSGKISIYTE